MKAFIYTGGRIFPGYVTDHPKSDDLVIAADAGYKNAALLGEHVNVLIGDLDSLGENNIPDGVELFRLKPEKDDTDTQVAVSLALDRGAREIVLVGGLSGRLDHTLSSLAILEDLNARGVYAVMTDGLNKVRFIRNSSALIPRSHYRYLSLIAADDKVKGVCAEGCRYPLNNAVLRRTYQYAVSNEIDGNCALISVKKGGLYIIESRDEDEPAGRG